MFVRHLKKSMIFVLVFLFILSGSRMAPAKAEGSTEGTICLLRCEGEVEIQDESGESRPAAENDRIGSEEAIITGEGALVSVALSPDRTVTMDANSRVKFIQGANGWQLALKKGGLFLDVRDDLGDEETLDIQTANVTVSIRGTIVYVSEDPERRSSTVGVLEGTAEVSYTDADGVARPMPIPAGTAVVFSTEDNGSGEQSPAEPKEEPLTQTILPDYVEEEIWNDSEIGRRVEEACEWSDYDAAGDWTWTGKVTLVAQSASKLYDGTPLTRFSDVLVYGLPSELSVRAAATGSLIDAGSSPNPVGSYTIYNIKGEDVTNHFSSIETIDGMLVVDPAPLTIWTASAEKVYDGMPLTVSEAGVRSCPGYEENMPAWRNLSYAFTQSAEAEVLYGICGVTWVHGTNPLTGETREILLYAGQKLTIFLHSEDAAQSIEFLVEEVAETELPEELLRLYADNPDLLDQAVQDTGWDRSVLDARINGLPARDGTEAMTEQKALRVEESAAHRLMADYTNVCIAIDSEITNYDSRPLSLQEAQYTQVHVDESITVTATGSQTEVGTSVNTCEIDWGAANPSNYIVSEELGTLTVTPYVENTTEIVTIDLGGYTAEFSGDIMLPDCPSSADATLVDFHEIVDDMEITTGAEATFSLPDGQIVLRFDGFKDVGDYTIAPEVSLSGSAKDVKLVFTNTSLTITPMEISVSLHDGSKIVYNGEEQCGNFSACNSISDIGYQLGTERGIVWGSGRILASVSGGGTDAGVYTLSCTWTYEDCDPKNYNITVTDTNLCIIPAELTVTTGSASKEYDGTPLTCAEASLTGLVNGETATVTATGSVTHVSGSPAENSYTIVWGTAKESNYTVVSETLGTLTLSKLTVSFDLGGGTVTYDGAFHGPSPSVSCSSNSNYSFFQTSSNEWTLQYSWGDTLTLIVKGGGTEVDTYAFETELSCSPDALADFDFSWFNDSLTITDPEILTPEG